MSRFNCPEELRDQEIVWGYIVDAACTSGGMGEYQLSNQLWALADRIRGCVEHGHRYVRKFTEPGTVATCTEPDLHRGSEGIAP